MRLLDMIGVGLPPSAASRVTKPKDAVDTPTASVEKPRPVKRDKRKIYVNWPKVPAQQPKDYRVITTAAELIAYLKRCEETGLCGFDYETTVSDEYRGLCERYEPIPEDAEFEGDEKEYCKAHKAWEEDFLKSPLDPHKAQICTVSLSAAPHEARVVFIDNAGDNRWNLSWGDNPYGGTIREEVFSILDEYLFKNQNITKIAVNLAFETKMTAALGKYIGMPVADPFVMWIRCLQVTAPEKIKNPKVPYAGLGLKPVTKMVFGVEMTPFEELLAKHKVQFFSEISADEPDAVKYSAEDSDYAVQHYLYWREVAKQIPMYDNWLHEIEMPFSRVIGLMEYHGMPWDSNLAEIKRQEAQNRLDEALSGIEQVASDIFGIKINAGKTGKTNDVKHVIFELMKLPAAKWSDKTEDPSLDEEAIIDMKFMLENNLQTIKEEKYLDVEIQPEWLNLDLGEDDFYLRDNPLPPGVRLSSDERKAVRIAQRTPHPYKDIGIKLLDLVQQAQTYTTLLSSHIEGREKFVNLVSGRIHAEYTPWTETSRLNSSKPKPTWATCA